MRRYIILVGWLWLTTSPLWGKIVFHSERDGNVEIYTMDADGSNQTRLTFNAVSDAYPVWSPDGQQITFQSDRDGNDEIYVMDTDGRNQRNLTNHPASDSFADWSPDGSRIIFYSGREVDGRIRPNRLFVMGSDGTDVKPLKQERGALRPKWSPDGTKIAFGGIYIVNAEGRAARRMPKRPNVDKVMCLEGWSPDGTQILYSERDHLFDKDTLVIATLPANGLTSGYKWRRVAVPSKLQMVYHSAAFSVDGKSILFSGRQADTDDWDIYRFRLADRKLTQLTANLGDNFAPQESNPRLSVSPQEMLPTQWGEIKTVKVGPTQMI